MTRRSDYLYTVQGRWQFPMDMLRRDRSQPVTGEDQEKVRLLSRDLSAMDLDNVSPDERRLMRRELVQIRLMIPGASFSERPLVARWESFGWKVVSEGDTVAEAPRDQFVPSAKVAEMTALAERGFAKLDPAERDAFRWLLNLRAH